MPDASNIISAFSEEHVERLTGLSKHKLRYWDRTGFFKPAFGAEDRRVAFSRVYSFKDIVSLRVLAVLQNQYNVPLQQLRRASEKLSHLENEKWSKTVLFVFNRKVVFIDPDTEKPREITSGQYVEPIVLERVSIATREDVRKLNNRAPAQVGAIERNRLVAHNVPVVAGTRIPTATIQRFHAAGYTPAQIILEYPDLTEKDIEAALRQEKENAAA